MLQSLLISAICFGCVSMIFMSLRESRWRKSSLVQGAAKMQMLPVTFKQPWINSRITATYPWPKKMQKMQYLQPLFSATAVLVASAPITRGHYRRNLTCSTKWTKHVLPQTGNLVSVANDQAPSKKDYCTFGKIWKPKMTISRECKFSFWEMLGPCVFVHDFWSWQYLLGKNLNYLDKDTFQRFGTFENKTYILIPT